jgi:concanavalin A-like lectin/glucanase superfamily protein
MPLLTALVASTAAPAEPSTLLDDLVMYLPFTETSGNAVDLVGGLTFEPANAPGSAAGLIYPTARHFTHALAQYLTLPDVAGDNESIGGGGDFTMAVWLYLDSLAGVTPNYHEIFGGLWGLRGYNLGHVANGDPEVFFQVSADDAGDTCHVNIPAPYLNTWHCIFAYYDIGETTLYLDIDNGVDTDVTVADMANNQMINYQRIGSDRNLTGIYFDGRMQSMCYWSRVLTPGERSEFYNDGAGWAYSG